MAKPAPLIQEIDALLARQTLPSVEELLRMVKRNNCRLNNLFTRMDGQYQCNLRTSNSVLYFDWGYGVTAGDAILKALRKMALHKAVDPVRGADDEADPTSVGSVSGDLTSKPIPPEELVNEPATDSDADAGQSAEVTDIADDDLIG